MSAIAEEFVRILTADTGVLARIRIAAVHHLAGVKHDFVPAAVLLFLPVGRQFVIPVDTYHSHAADETIVATHSSHAADQIDRAGQHIQETLRLHRSAIHVQD